VEILLNKNQIPENYRVVIALGEVLQ